MSIYVEKAYPGGQVPSAEEVAAYSEATVKELCEWGFTGSAEVVDPTWIDVAYTWSRPRSAWRGAALKALRGALHRHGGPVRPLGFPGHCRFDS